MLFKYITDFKKEMSCKKAVFLLDLPKVKKNASKKFEAFIKSWLKQLRYNRGVDHYIIKIVIAIISSSIKVFKTNYHFIFWRVVNQNSMFF